MSEFFQALKQTRASVPQANVALKAVVAVLALCLLSKWTANSRPTYSKTFLRQVQNITRDATNSSEASEQDKNPLIGLLNITSALAYLKAARKFATDRDITRITGLNMDELMGHLEDRQQALMHTIGSTCPAIRSSGVFVPV